MLERPGRSGEITNFVVVSGDEIMLWTMGYFSRMRAWFGFHTFSKLSAECLMCGATVLPGQGFTCMSGRYCCEDHALEDQSSTAL